MKKKILGVGVPLLALTIVIGLIWLASGNAVMQVVDTHGTIATAQRSTLYTATFIMLLIVIPVFMLTFFISIKYRETNKKARYTPEWESSKKLETIWWGVPILIVTVLSVITWQTSHSLDPYKPLESAKVPVKIQVVALQWKWLFIYPERKVASVNEFAMPINTPVEFTITSDAPMNSFWIPQLGGQIYAMSGMSTKLHLDATKVGDYRGVSANLSGEGHSDMDFSAKAMTENDYERWIQTASTSAKVLDKPLYEKLRKPGEMDVVTYYNVFDQSMYDSIVNRYAQSGPSHARTIREGDH